MSLKERLDVRYDPSAEQALWHRIARSRVRKRRLRRSALTVGAVAAAAGLFAVSTWWPGSPHVALELDGQIAAGALPPVAEFADGSEVRTTDGVVEVLDNDEQRFTVVLRSGRSHFRVTPGGPRRWMVLAGAVRVEVVGTEFDVVRNDEHVRVIVDHGTVLVHAAGLEDGVRRLVAGSSVALPSRPSSPTRDDGDSEDGDSEDGVLAERAVEGTTDDQQNLETQESDAPRAAPIQNETERPQEEDAARRARIQIVGAE